MLTNMKRNLGLLLAVATLSAVTALVPSTAGAAASIVPAPGTVALPHNAPDDTTALKACPGDSASAAGFTDTTSTDVDCVKMFGITTGATATTYDPTGTIPRWAMALFIHRMFVPAGVAAAGTTTVPTFTDTSGLSAEILAAISALASHGITLGTSSTTFAPDDNVTRAQMATFLSRFLKIAKTAAGGTIATTIATQKYNYTDIASVTPEESESIIRGYNLGLHGASCVVDALVGTCAGSTAYRPADDMTRAEMASMIVAALNHTNARPAGVSIQTTSANLTVGTVTVAINVRNADFSAQANTLVDEFHSMHNDLLTAVAPFHAILGTCTGVGKTRGGALCVVDSGDFTSDIRGNIVGSPQVTSAYKTANWWVQTGASGSQFVNGTTATFDTYSINWGAASTLVNATHRTYSQPNAYTLSESKAAASGITLQDGINTWAGASRTFSVTLSSTASPLATIKAGYSIKVATVTQDNLGNIANTTAYYPVSGTTASFTTTCPADTSLLNTDWWVAIEHTITMGTALGGTGRPTGAADPTAAYGTGVADTGTVGKVGLTCDDTIRAYTSVETMAIGENNFTSSTAGSLAAVTATAYDQYGDGIAGTGVEITSVRTPHTGSPVTAVAASLTSGAGGIVSLSAVVCATGEREVAYSVTDPGGAFIDLINATVPGAKTVEGTTIYCSTAATGGAFGDVSAVAEIQTIALAGTGLGGTFALTYNGATAATVAFAANQAAINGLLDGLSSLADGAAVSAAPTTSADASSWVVTFNTNWGNAGAFTCDVTNITVTSGDKTCTITQGTEGVAAVTIDFLDDNQTTSKILTKVTTTGVVVAASAAVVTYRTYGWDSGDSWTVGAAAAGIAVIGGTETEFKAAMTAETGSSVEVKGSYRTGATTTGVSAFQLG